MHIYMYIYIYIYILQSFEFFSVILIKYINFLTVDHVEVDFTGGYFGSGQNFFIHKRMNRRQNYKDTSKIS